MTGIFSYINVINDINFGIEENEEKEEIIINYDIECYICGKEEKDGVFCQECSNEFCKECLYKLQDNGLVLNPEKCSECECNDIEFKRHYIYCIGCIYGKDLSSLDFNLLIKYPY